MDKEKLQSLLDLGKKSEQVKEAFLKLEEIAEFLKSDKKFFSFAKVKSVNGFVSPSEMIILLSDYINKTGKYEEYLKAYGGKGSDKKETKTPKQKISIFDLEL